MDPTVMAAIHEKIKAAEQLGMKVEQSYTEIEGSFFTTLSIKNGDEIIKAWPVPQDKAEVLNKMRAQVAAMKDQIASIEADIITIEAIGS